MKVYSFGHVCDRSNWIKHCKAQMRMLKGELCHSTLHYDIVSNAGAR